MTTHLVTFATEDFKYSAINLRHSALQYGVDHVYIYNENDIKSFSNKHPEIFKYKKGYGCYSWQPYILLDVFKKIKENDIIIYCDAGILFINHIQRLIRLCNQHKRLFFKVGDHVSKNYINLVWSKKYIFHKMACNLDKYYNAYQVMGGFQMYVKNSNNFRFINEFLHYCSDYKIITDINIPEYDNDPEFKQHRHNQSILTNLVTKHNYKTFRDPSQYGIKDIVVDSPYNYVLNIHRQKITKIIKIVIITPTTGDYRLKRCIESVQNQTYRNIEHVIVIDGPEYTENANEMINQFHNKNELTIFQLPKNTGKNLWNGHRIYGSIPYLCDTDYICYLDEDNWYEPEHIESLLSCIYYGKLDWSYSFRKIVNKEGKFITNDNCENLGNLHHVFNNSDDFLIDTSCYMLKRDIAIKLSYVWNTKARDIKNMEVDRYLYQELNKKYPNYGTNCKYTLNYTVGNQEHSVTKEFFLYGNQIMNTKFKNMLPWNYENKQNLYIIHFNKEMTIAYLNLPKINKCRSYAFENWQMSLLDEFSKYYNLKNAYIEEIPTNSIVFINMCNPTQLPLLLNRTDLIKICYTAEGPNIRHVSQWKYGFLKKYFTHVLTYYQPLLRYDTNFFTYCRFIHRLDLDNKYDKKYLYSNNKIDRTICFIGENREILLNYEIDGVKLKCLDGLRKKYVENLKNIVVFGDGWNDVPNIKIGKTKYKRNDGHSVNIIKDFTFCLIIENCNAPGYVSEKIYDAFCANVIPIYYGNIDTTVNIPDNMYIDLKNIKPTKLQNYIDHISDIKIASMIKTIEDNRENILKSVSPKLFFKAFEKVVKKL